MTDSLAPAHDHDPTHTILIVDDDHAFRQAMGRALRRRGATVLEASTGADALDQTEQEQPSGVLLDLCLREVNGLELIEGFIQRAPELRLVVLTGYASLATAVEAVKLGAIQYLPKPVEPDDALEALTTTATRPQPRPAATPMSPQRLEWEHLQRVLQRHQGNISAAARALGMHRRSLQRKLAKRPHGQ